MTAYFEQFWRRWFHIVFSGCRGNDGYETSGNTQFWFVEHP